MHTLFQATPPLLSQLLGLFAGSLGAERHSVLYVDFSGTQAPCPLGNAQTLDAESALRHLRDGSSWAALAIARDASPELCAWLMRVRHDASSASTALLVLLDAAAPVDAAAATLRAGADVALPRHSPPDLLKAQMARLRERVAPPPLGTLALGPRMVLQAPTRQLWIDGRPHALQPQPFRLLWTLAAASGRVVGTGALRVALDVPARARDEALHTAVGRLRRLLRAHAQDARLQTVHGSGYRWDSERCGEA
ncbi:bifunctional uroporphyrinogen-III synthetase/response regulator domain protein [mine drainage metagenome]|uniref:Bifunctional uroporphyrinogen-III synthetase/response regulator domain protein n=1 Tax=mine drainage metagenome TaxID=410659 RepID=A0A1J5QP90_9ZZZZ